MLLSTTKLNKYTSDPDSIALIEIIDYQFQDILKFTDYLGVTRNALSVCLICHCFLHLSGGLQRNRWSVYSREY